MSGRVLVTRRAHSWPTLVARFRGTSIDVEVAPTTEQVEPLDPPPGGRGRGAGWIGTTGWS
jgi:hypothetical protein